MKDFNIAKYLRENHLGSHAILGGYVDLHALKEDLSSDQAAQEYDSEPVKTFKINVALEALGELDAEFEKRNNVTVKKPKGAEELAARYDKMDWLEKYKYSDVPVNFTGTKDALANLLNGDLASQIYGDEDAYFNALNRLFKNPKNMNGLKEKEEMELDTEIPYEGPESKVDGFGDEFVQDSPVEEAESMDNDDSVNPFPSLNRMGGYSDEQDKFDRMLGLSHEYIGKVSPIVRKTINSLRNDGFDDKDIIDFLASDLS